MAQKRNKLRGKLKVLRNKLRENISYKEKQQIIEKIQSITKNLYSKEEKVKPPKTPRKTAIKEKKLQVEWENVDFNNKKIRIQFSPEIYSTFLSWEESRKSFNSLKPFLRRISLPPLEIILHGAKLLNAKGLENFYEVVGFLRVSKLIFEYRTNPKGLFHLYDHQELRRIKNELIPYLVDIPIEKEGYFKALCHLQDESRRIIPVIEPILSSNGGYQFEDTFLFSITKGSMAFIVWESTKINRASFVFHCALGSYDQMIQTLFDFLSSEKRFRRSSLKIKELNSHPRLGFLSAINHDDLFNWVMRLTSLMNTTEGKSD